MVFSTLFLPRKLRSNDAIVGNANPSEINLAIDMLPTGTRSVSTLNDVVIRPQVPETQPIYDPDQTPNELGKRMINIEHLLGRLVPSVQQIQDDILELKTGQSQQINTLSQKISTLEEDLKCVKTEKVQLKQDLPP